MGFFDWRNRSATTPVTVDGAMATASAPIKDCAVENIAAGAAAGATIIGATRDLGEVNFSLGDFVRPHSVLVALSNANYSGLTANHRIRIQWSRDNSVWLDAPLTGATAPVLATANSVAGAQLCYCRALVLGRYYRWVYTNGTAAASPLLTTWMWAMPTGLA